MSTFFSSKTATARGTDTQQKIQRSLFSDIRAILTKCEKPCSCHAQLDKLMAFHLTHNEEKVQKKTSVTTKPKSRKSPHEFSKKMGYLTRASSADSGISSCSPKGRRILEDKSIKMVSSDNIVENPAMHGDGQAVRDSPETDSVLIANSVVDTRPITPRNRTMVKSNLFSSTQNSSNAQNILQITEMTLSERRKSTRKTRVPSFIIDKGQAPPTSVQDSPETGSLLIANSVMDTRPITPRNRKMVKSNLFSGIQNSSNAQNKSQITEMTLSERRKSTRKTRVPSSIIDKGQAPPTSVQDSPETGSLLIANSVMDTRPITPRNRKMVKSNLFSGIQNSSNAQNKSQITEMTLSERRKSTRKTRVPSSIIDKGQAPPTSVQDSPETGSLLIANSVMDTRPITPRNRKMVKSNLFSGIQNSSNAQNKSQITEMTLSERRKSTRKTRVPSSIIDKGQAPPTSVQDSPETGSLLIANSVMDIRPITPRNRKMVKSNLFSGIQNSSNAQNKSQITEMTLSERRKSTRKTRVPSSIIDLKVHDVIQKILLKRQKHKRQKLSFNRTTTSTATISDEESSIKKRKSVNRSGKTDKISKVLRKSDLKPVKEISERRSLPIAKAKSSSNIIKSAKRNETRRLSDLKIQDVIPKKRLPNRTTSSTALHEPNPKSVERALKQVQKATTLRKSDINPRAQISNNSTETLRKSLQLAKAKSSSNFIKSAIRNEAVRVIAPFINTQPVTKYDFRKLARGSWMLDRSENNLSDSSFINRRTSPRHKKSPTRSSPRRKKRRLYSPEQVMISKQFLSLLENE